MWVRSFFKTGDVLVCEHTSNWLIATSISFITVLLHVCKSWHHHSSHQLLRKLFEGRKSRWQPNWSSSELVTKRFPCHMLTSHAVSDVTESLSLSSSTSAGMTLLQTHCNFSERRSWRFWLIYRMWLSCMLYLYHHFSKRHFNHLGGVLLFKIGKVLYIWSHFNRL